MLILIKDKAIIRYPLNKVEFNRIVNFHISEYLMPHSEITPNHLKEELECLYKKLPSDGYGIIGHPLHKIRP